MIRRIGQVAAGLVALVVTLGIVGGIPAGLVRFVGWPLPEAWPTLDELRQFAQVGVSDQTIIKALALVVWIAWAQVAAAIVAEAAGLVRGRTAARLRVLPGLQPFAARLVAAIALVAAASASPRTAAMAAPLQAVVATASATVAIEADDALPDAAPLRRGADTDAMATVVTTARDSWWQLAETHLGDGARWRELRDVNVGRDVAPGVTIQADTTQLDAGWQIRVPVTATTGPQVADSPQAAAEPVEQEWEVEPGDHFWHIAEQTLTEAWDRTPTDAEVAPYWRQLVDDNRDRLLPPGDPDLIYPDQHFELPSPPADPSAPAPIAPPIDHSAPVPDPVPSDPAPAPSEVGEALPAATPTEAAADLWRGAIERGNPVAAPERSTGTAVNDIDADAEADARNGFGVPVGLAAGAAAAGLLAAGLTTLLRWRRRAAMRQRPEGYRLPTPLPWTEAMITRLEAAAPPEPVLADLASLLATIPPDTHPALVTTLDDGTVTLLFDDQVEVPEPPSPWTLADDGADGPVGWTARLGDRGPDRSIGLPLLATLGRTGETTVLANIAAMPQLAVEGADEDVRRMLRCMTMEVATSRIAVPVEVVIIRDYLLATLDNTRRADDPHAEVEAALREIEQGVIPDDRTPRLLVCHPPTESTDVPPALRGPVGVLTTAAADVASRWTLQIEDRATGRLVLPDGGSVELTLPDVEPFELDEELRHLARGATQPDEPPAAAAADTEDSEGVLVDVTTNGHRPPPAAPAPTDPPWCEVRLLGPVEVFKDGVCVENIPPRSLELLVYLATHRDAISKERLDTIIWGGHAARPGSQRVTAALTKLRDALGDGPDGEPLVPRRTRDQRIELSGDIGTDLDRALAHIAIGRDLPGEAGLSEQAAALDLVRGEPLQELPVSWGSEVVQRAIAELQDAALDLARARRETGDYDAAEDAARRGLRLLDPADALYLELAEIEHARGRPDRVASLWRQLCQRHGEDADEISGLVSSPPPEIELAFRSLVEAAT